MSPRSAHTAAGPATLVLLVIVTVGAAGCATSRAEPVVPGGVLVVEVRSAITPVTADHVIDALERAERHDAVAVVVELDTPGGLDASTRDIVQAMLAAEVPVLVHVSPSGARAASAGALITIAAHVAAMSPGSAIGAATPVDLEGGDVARKVVNDTAAFAESIARTRDRDVEFAGDMVRDGRSASAVDAVDLGAVDLIASSRAGLLDAVDGMSVRIGSEARRVTLATADAPVVEIGFGALQSVRQILVDPTVVALLLSIGTLGLIYELATPGLGAGGAVGAISILLALYGVAVLPVNAAGLLLLALAVGLFVAEVLAPGVGVAAVGGTVALVLSGVFLVRDVPGLEVSLAATVPAAVVAGGAVVVAGRLALRARGAPSPFGLQQLVGQPLIVSRSDGTSGQARHDGSWWGVRSDAGELRAGDRVRVVDVDGLELVVRPEPDVDELEGKVLP